MAKGKRKSKLSAEEIEADRLAAHKSLEPIVGPNVQAGEFDDSKLQANIDENFRVIEMAPENLAEVHNAIAEALGEEPLKVRPVFRTPDEAEGEIDHITNDEVKGDRYHEERIDTNVEDEFGPAGKLGELEEEQALAEVEEEAKLPNSVVAEKFKLKYIENAKMAGVPGKAAKRSNWDWLAQQIAMACLGEKDKIRIDDFRQLLDDNGVDHSRWTNRNKGWEGRFRMTGRVALQKVVANAGVLKVGESEVLAPAEFVEKYKTKA